MRVLVVEDDERIADFISRALHSEGHVVTTVNQGKPVESLVQNGDFDLVLLDLMLPDTSGLDICQKLRFRKNRIPIIMLTAMDATEDIVQGLKMGADDYMTKPFDIDELLARMESVYRRFTGAADEDPLLVIDNVCMDTDAKTVTVNDTIASLTAKEFAILELFMRNPNKLFSRERILTNVWGTNVDPLTNVIDVYIGRIRKKLSKDDTVFIETVRGMGYRLNQNLNTPKTPD